MKVFIYRNLNHLGYVYSIKSLEGISKNRVIGYAPRIVIESAEFVVSEAGRQRVLRQRRKNVHAGVVGDLSVVSGWITRMHISKADFDYCNYENFCELYPPGIPITYNPFLYTSFVCTHTERPVQKAKRVIFCDGIVTI